MTNYSGSSATVGWVIIAIILAFFFLSSISNGGVGNTMRTNNAEETDAEIEYTNSKIEEENEIQDQEQKAIEDGEKLQERIDETFDEAIENGYLH